MQKIFTASELQNTETHNLAGKFAAKEAFFKALGKKIDWLEVWIEHLETGQLVIKSTALDSKQEVSVSVSYSGDFVIAICIISDK